MERRQPTIEAPKWALNLLNNLYEIEKKLGLHGDQANALRNIEKIKEILKGQGLTYEDPMGQRFTETRTDIEATISGSGTENLVVVEVIKPIVRAEQMGMSRIIQKGIVVVESK